MDNGWRKFGYGVAALGIVALGMAIPGLKGPAICIAAHLIHQS